MSDIPSDLRRFVEERAKHRCEYCHTQEIVIGMPLEVEHITPVSQGGITSEATTCLACPRCNRYKAVQTTAIDNQTGLRASLFNPREMDWVDHFFWDQKGLFIVGLTAIGRATVNALQMNNQFVIRSRQIWISAGWHPPQE